MRRAIVGLLLAFDLSCGGRSDLMTNDALIGDAGAAAPEALPCPRTIYLFLYPNALATFSPATGAVTMLGTVPCPVAADGPVQQWIAGALARDGSVYTPSYASSYVFNGLYRIDPSSLACAQVPLTASAGSSAFARSNNVVGMAYVADPTNGGEHLYFVGDSETVVPTSKPQLFLAEADTTDSTWSAVGWLQDGYSSPISLPVFGGDALSLFYPPGSGEDGIYGVNVTNATVTLKYMLPAAIGGYGLNPAPAVRWGGDYYLFPPFAPGPITRFRPSDNSWTQVGTTATNLNIRAATAAACAAD
jgi:hypothetical protein